MRRVHANIQVLKRDYRGLGKLIKLLHEAFAPRGRIITLAYYPDGMLCTRIHTHPHAYTCIHVHIHAYTCMHRHMLEHARQLSE